MRQVALVTGASRGIGRAVALELGRAGYAVCVNYLSNEDAARQVADTLRAGGSDAVAIRADVADSAAVAEMVRRTEKELGPVTLLVNNAGVAGQAQFQDISDEMWNRYLAVNLGGARNTIRAVLPHMLSEKQGAIVNISSIWGISGASCEVHYSAAKAGLIGLTKALAKEEGPSGITVNCVAPGVIDTDMMAAFTAEDKAALAEETPVGRLGSADEVAQLLVFLAGESAGYITGQVFGVNGGLVI